MGKKIISLLLCLGLILGNTNTVYAVQTAASVSQEETVENADSGSAEAETVSDSDNSDDASTGDTADSFGIAILRSEGGVLQYADSMKLPDEEESSDEDILDLRHIPSARLYRTEKTARTGQLRQTGWMLTITLLPGTTAISSSGWCS